MILQTARLVRPLDFLISINLNEEELIEELEAVEDLTGYLQKKI